MPEEKQRQMANTRQALTGHAKGCCLWEQWDGIEDLFFEKIMWANCVKTEVRIDMGRTLTVRENQSLDLNRW